jgi:hypothetical protein
VASTAADVFNGDAFRRVDRDRSAGRIVNKALFDAVMLAFYFAHRTQVVARKSEVAAALQSLLKTAEFDALIGRATANRTRIFGRIRASSERLAELGIATIP